jgi:4-hydroxybenzoate polyprenyltransferase
VKFDLILYAVLLSGSLVGAYCQTLPAFRKFRTALYLGSTLYDLSFMSWLIVGVLDSSRSGNWKMPMLVIAVCCWALSMLYIQAAKKREIAAENNGN